MIRFIPPSCLTQIFFLLGQVGLCKQNTQLNFHKGAIRHSDLHSSSSHIAMFCAKKSGEQTQKQKNMDLCSIARHRGCLKTEAGAFLKFLKSSCWLILFLKVFWFSFFHLYSLFFLGGNHRTYFSLTALYMMPKHPWCIGWDVDFCGGNPKHDPPWISQKSHLKKTPAEF